MRAHGPLIALAALSFFGCQQPDSDPADRRQLTDINGDVDTANQALGTSCAVSNGGCSADATCALNANGKVTCACHVGFKGNGKTCRPLACTVNNGGCSAEASCAMVANKITCTCNPGFKGSGKTCADINECAKKNGSCGKGVVCVNTVGSHTCGGCAPGFVFNGTACVDINECATNNGGCSPNANCTNKPGSFTCTCKTGFTGDGIVCTNSNACATNNGGCSQNATCASGASGVTCTCNPGFSGTGVICQDINECAINNGGCGANASCTNNAGGFVCACNPGFSGVGGICTDINECATSNGGCSVNATCTNTPGSSSCACNPGFTGDGIVCAPVGVDSQAPSILSITGVPASVDITQGDVQVILTATAQDAGTAGVRFITLSYTAPSMLSPTSCTIEASGPPFPNSLTGSCTLTLSQSGEIGQFKLSATTTDGSGNTKTYNSDDLQLIANSITTTVTSSAVDTIAPNIISITGVPTTVTITGNGFFNFSMHVLATDNLTGVQEVRLWFENDIDQIPVAQCVLFPPFGVPGQSPLEGPCDGQFTTFEPLVSGAVYKLKASTTDAVSTGGNTRFYSTADLATIASPTTSLTVTLLPAP